MHAVLTLLFRVLGHQLCCKQAAWTAYLGLQWEPIYTDGSNRWRCNLYNLIWLAKDRIRSNLGDG